MMIARRRLVSQWCIFLAKGIAGPAIGDPTPTVTAPPISAVDEQMPRALRPPLPALMQSSMIRPRVVRREGGRGNGGDGGDPGTPGLVD